MNTNEIKLIQATTRKGSITNCIYLFVSRNEVYCFSYGSLVASIINGVYQEYEGEKYFSTTSCKHKTQFRREYQNLIKIRNVKPVEYDF